MTQKNKLLLPPLSMMLVALIFLFLFCAEKTVAINKFTDLYRGKLFPHKHQEVFLPNYAASFAAVNNLANGSEEKCQNGGQNYRGACKCFNYSDFSGLHCEMCERNGVCSAYSGEPSECNRALVTRGDNKQFACKLTPKYLSLLGGGRDIQASIEVNFTTDDPDGFVKTKNGTSSVVLYRIEPNEEFVDSFFACNLATCSMNLHSEPKQSNDGQSVTLKRLFNVLTIVGGVTLVFLCVLLALLRCFLSKLKRQRVIKIATSLGIILTVFTAIFIAAMLILMRPTVMVNSVIYKCNSTKCECTEDPVNKSYTPVCSKSAIKSILPTITGGVELSCDLDSKKCKLVLDGFLIIDLTCDAAECVNTKRFPFNPTADSSNIAQIQKTLLIVLLVALAVITLIISAHVVFLMSRSRRRSAEFIRMFGFCDLLQQQSANNNKDGINKADKNNINILSAKKKRRTSEPTLGNNLFSRDNEVSMPEINNNNNHNNNNNNCYSSSSSRCCCRFETRPPGMDSVESYRHILMSSFELCLKDVTYSLPISTICNSEAAPARIILHQISLKVVSGDVLAILGPSGAGKTTLLDIMSARNKQGRIEGNITLNGAPLDTSSKTLNMYRNIIGYVSQEDSLLPALTVHQTIEYAARLKLPCVFSKKAIKGIVHHMIELLKLQQCQETLIGDGSGLRGVSGGEKRRVSIAVELLANPRILFLDEPTSGLDAVSAKRVIEAVVALAKESPMQNYAPYFFSFKPIVVLSIHQPSQEIFELFDKILLLSRGINIYCGPARNAAETLETTVKRHFGPVRPVPSRLEHPNHAEYIMKLEELLDNNTRLAIQKEGVQIVPVSHEGTELFEEAQEGRGNMFVNNSTYFVPGNQILTATASLRMYYANMYQQVLLLTSRAANCMVSSFNLVTGHSALTAFLGSMMMLLYNEQALDLSGSVNRAGSITFLLLVLSLISLSCLDQIFAERKLFVVERENGFYRTLPYLLSKIFVDIIPLRIIPALVLSSIIYFPMGFRVDNSIHFFWFIFILTVFSVCVTFISLCIGVLMGTFGSAALLSSAVILWNFVFGGFLVQSMTLPVFLRAFQFISPFFLAFESLLVNELAGQDCTFSPIDETGKPSPSKYSIKCEQYLWNFGLQPERFNLDVGLLAAFTVVLIALAWLLLAKCISIAR